MRAIKNGGTGGGGGVTDYNDLTNKPTLGTAAAKNIPASGNASSTQVVYGNDTRLTDSRTPTLHTHTLSNITDAGNAAGKNVGTASNNVAAGDAPLAAADPTPATITFTDPFTPNYSNGRYQRIVANANFTLMPPTGGSDGSKIKLRILASGAVTLTVDSGIVIPSDSAFGGTKVLEDAKTYILQLEKITSIWVLETLIGGY